MISGPEFVAQVVELAEKAGGRVHVDADPSFPCLLVIRGDTLVVAHVGSGPASYRVQEWLAAFSRVRRVVTAAWTVRDGLAGPTAVLSGDGPAEGDPPASWCEQGPLIDECGQPAGCDEGGRRGD